jgi:hypothetical protein
MPGTDGKRFEDSLDFSWNFLEILSAEASSGILLGATPTCIGVIARTGTAHTEVERNRSGQRAIFLW